MTQFNIPLPENIDFIHWASVVNEELALYNVGIPLDEDAWVSWALNVCDVLDLVAEGLPNPLGFDDWRTWAARFSDIAQG